MNYIVILLHFIRLSIKSYTLSSKNTDQAITRINASLNAATSLVVPVLIRAQS